MTVYYPCPVCGYDVDDDNEWIKKHPIEYCECRMPYHKACGIESHFPIGCDYHNTNGYDYKQVQPKLSDPQDYEVVEARYIFLDIENFTLKRTVDAQKGIIDKMNEAVQYVVGLHKVDNNVIYMPTGDGMCIALVNLKPQDTLHFIHLQIALDIIQEIEKHNLQAHTDEHKFRIRFGINEGRDVLFKDIRGNENIAGMGINKASRVMSFADGNQIILSNIAWEPLSQYRQYRGMFKMFEAEIKGFEDNTKIYQFKDSKWDGLNCDIPSAFYEIDLKNIVINKSWKFVYNPTTNESKELYLSEGGVITRGKNSKENSWRIMDDKLEFIDEKGQLYSRFKYYPEIQSFFQEKSTKDRKYRNQFISNY